MIRLNNKNYGYIPTELIDDSNFIKGSSINTNPVNGSSFTDLQEFFYNNPNFRGMVMRNDKPIKMNKNDLLIINMDDNIGNGTHWVGCTYNCYFDSFGLPVPEEIKKNYPHLKYYNDQPVQHKDATSCGYWVIWFLSHRITTKKEFIDLMLTVPKPFTNSIENEKYLSKWINKTFN